MKLMTFLSNRTGRLSLDIFRKFFLFVNLIALGPTAFSAHPYPPAKLNASESALLIQDFDQRDASMGDWRSRPVDRELSFALMMIDQGVVFDAYLDMYELTGNVKYLRRFVDQADRVLAHRDDVAKFVDWTNQPTKKGEL